MACSICGRREPPERCNEGYLEYLSGEYPCPFSKGLSPRNLVELPPIEHKRVQAPEPQPSAEGLEDLL